jgi:hypothetical protein
LYVPLLQVQLRLGRSVALAGQPHWDAEDAPRRE